MKVFSLHGTLQELCKEQGKWGMYIEFGDDDFDELKKAAPYLTPEVLGEDYYQIMLDGIAEFTFDSEAEMMDYYRRTVGKDGPTKLNPYDGETQVTAVTCNPEGEWQSENR